MCFDSPYYGQFAYNMACSIKAHSSLPIHLIADKKSIISIDKSVFDSIEYYDFEKEGNRTNIGLTKVLLFDRSPFERTLYLDVDGVLFKDPEPLFEIFDTIFVQVTGKGNLEDEGTATVWAKNEDLRERFGISGEVYATQTSIIYFDKKAKKFFEQLKSNFENRFERDEYATQWGKRQEHPDELYYSITLNQMGIKLPEIYPVFIPDRLETVTNILQKHYVLSMLGGWNNTKPYAKDLYDKIMSKLMKGMGRSHNYRATKLYQNKFVTKR